MDLRPNDAALAAGAAEPWPQPAPAAAEQQTKEDEPAPTKSSYTGWPRGIITVSYFACFGSIGVSLASLGPILLQLSVDLRTSLDSLGFLFVARSAGYLVGSAAAGWLFDRARRTHALMLGGMLLSSVGCAVLSRCTTVAAAAVAVSTQGLCMGMLDTGGNCLLIWLHGPRRVEPFMQAMHGLFGVGAFLSPLFIDWSAYRGSNTPQTPATPEGQRLAIAAAASRSTSVAGRSRRRAATALRSMGWRSRSPSPPLRSSPSLAPPSQRRSRRGPTPRARRARRRGAGAGASWRCAR
jgi:MFS family permease